MKKPILRLPIMMVAAILLMFASCKKESSTLDDSVSAEDQSNISASMNAVSDDATTAVGKVQSISGKTDGVIISLCGATVNATDSGQKKLTITYNGASCNGVSRTGTVVVTLSSGNHWRDAGAAITVDFSSGLTVVLTNGLVTKTYVLTGTHTITNTTGGLAWEILANGSTLDGNGTTLYSTSHRHTGNMSIGFGDGTNRTWTIDRTRTFTKPNGVETITLSAEGAGSVEATGTNRNGNTFTNSILTPISVNSTCGWNKPTVGEYKHEILNRSVDILFGVDANGDPATGCNAAGYKITYTKGNKTLTRFVQYWH